MPLRAHVGGLVDGRELIGGREVACVRGSRVDSCACQRRPPAVCAPVAWFMGTEDGEITPERVDEKRNLAARARNYGRGGVIVISSYA